MKSDRAGLSVGGAKALKPYRDAVLGFRNHWYPAFLSQALKEGEFRPQEMLGERILFKRIDGKVHAIEDRCIHRGVPLSAKPESHTKNTISCWYHGFTYSFQTGELVAVITDPECPMVGKARLEIYPVEERKGLVFVYIGDGEPPPLALDLQPGLLDDEMVLYPDGEHIVVNCNWRFGAENGVDASHIYIHRDAGLLTAAEMALPLASYFVDKTDMVREPDDGPKGVIKGAGKKVAVWEAEVEGVKVTSRYLPGINAKAVESTDTSLWLPCGLKVDPFPAKGIVQFEWYVPRDEKSHHYIVTWGRRVSDDADRETFFAAMRDGLKDQVVNAFNNDDVWAREAMERFYAEENGWERERLFRPDLILVEWRKLASRHNRGIQRRAHGKSPHS